MSVAGTDTAHVRLRMCVVPKTLACVSLIE